MKIFLDKVVRRRMKKLFSKFKLIFRRNPQKLAYPRTYSNKELEKEIDQCGNENPNSHLGPSYYTRASLGLTELERRSSNLFGIWSLVISVFALSFSFLAVRYAAEQTRLTQIQTIPEQINQARATQNAVEFCKENPDTAESGLYRLDGSGIVAPCSEVLRLYKVEIPKKN